MDTSLLLYEELLGCLADAKSYFAAYSIFSALIFSFDCEFKRSSSKSVLIPHKPERLLRTLQDASVQPMDELSWHRHLLVIKLFDYYLQRDFHASRQRNYDAASLTDKRWVLQTRTSHLLRDEDEIMCALAGLRMRNN